MPILTRRRSRVPSASIRERTPLCPPALPVIRMRTLPRGRSRSSKTTMRSAGPRWSLRAEPRHRGSRDVHVGPELDQVERIAAPARLRHQVTGLAGEARVDAAGEPIHDALAHVVTRVPILRPWVAEADDGLGHLLLLVAGLLALGCIFLRLALGEHFRLGACQRPSALPPPRLPPPSAAPPSRPPDWGRSGCARPRAPSGP